MTTPGFYRIEYDGQPGVGRCHVQESASRGETYELWDVLFVSNVFGGRTSATSHLNSTSAAFDRLKVGKRIRGLP